MCVGGFTDGKGMNEMFAVAQFNVSLLKDLQALKLRHFFNQNVKVKRTAPTSCQCSFCNFGLYSFSLLQMSLRS